VSSGVRETAAARPASPGGAPANAAPIASNESRAGGAPPAGGRESAEPGEISRKLRSWDGAAFLSTFTGDIEEAARVIGETRAPRSVETRGGRLSPEQLCRIATAAKAAPPAKR
jgi:hypothetical protein